jgi:ribosomal protein S12 methylthiotransferase accessory factor
MAVELLTRPRLKRHLRAAVVDRDRTVIFGEGKSSLLKGQVHARLIPLLDGARSTDEIVTELMSDLSATDIYYALLMLQKRGDLEEAEETLAPGVAAYWSSLGFDAQDVAAGLHSREVAPVAVGTVGGAELAEVLGRNGLRTPGSVITADEALAWLEPRSGDTSCLFVLADDYLRPELAALNDCALRTGTPLLLVRGAGTSPWIGPLLVPGRTGCLACLAQRLRANREVESFLERSAGVSDAHGTRTLLPAAASAAVNLASAELARWIVADGQGPPSRLEGCLLTLEVAAMTIEQHVLMRRPQCERCGDEEARRPEPRPIRLQPRRKAATADGGHRAEAPDVTLRRLRPHVSPITGVARGLIRATKSDDKLLHVYISGQNLARRSGSLDELRNLIRGNSCGKGVTDVQAQVSALGEAVERYSGVFRGEESRIPTTLSRLDDEAIDPTSCMLYSEAQYRERARWNASDHLFDKVPLPFDPDAEMDWSPVWSLTHDRFRYLPTSYLYYSYPFGEDAFFCKPDSNGCAAGATVEDAVLQGFLELVERDAVALWWYNRVRRPAIDLSSCGHPFVAAMARRYEELGRTLWVLDLTNDLGVPAMIALSHRPDRDQEDIIFAPAAHLEPEIALLRALTELNQMLPGVDTETAEHGEAARYRDPSAVRWWKTATLDNQPYLRPRDDESATRLEELPALASNDLRTDIELLRGRCEALGLEVFVLDQTRPDIGIPVVKVIVPGLRHFWARFAPGRLFDVPPGLGWLGARTAEEALNPIQIFI